MDKTILSVFGTRPECIKMAPLIRKLSETEGLKSRVCFTGQHRDLSPALMETFGVRADHDLAVMAEDQSLAEIASRILTRMDKVLEAEKPDLVLVHGDTESTLAGALSAFYHRIPVGHVEAGLRTGDLYAPFPEEMNRKLVSDIAQLHFCPTEGNQQNLLAEGVTGELFVTGNTIIDAVRATVQREYVFSEPLLNRLDYENKKVLVVTCHRRENYGEPMENVMRAIKKIAASFEATEIVFPVHPAPYVRRCVRTHLQDVPNIHLIEPLGILDMHNLLARCCFALTDSGGLQEEAPALGRPVLVLREVTERPEAVAAGTVRVVGTGEEDIISAAAGLLLDETQYDKMAYAVSPYGDGRACERIVQGIQWHFGLCPEKPADFRAVPKARQSGGNQSGIEKVCM